jgi:lambda repressor-like predicted transcriptional regulator
MIDADKCSAILALHQEGMGLRDISRRLRLGRNTVRRILRRQGRPAAAPCTVRVQLDPERLRTLYQECDGRAQRVHEKLVEEEGIAVTYPTLTRRLRELCRMPRALAMTAQAQRQHTPHGLSVR